MSSTTEALALRLQREFPERVQELEDLVHNKAGGFLGLTEKEQLESTVFAKYRELIERRIAAFREREDLTEAKFHEYCKSRSMGTVLETIMARMELPEFIALVKRVQGVHRPTATLDCGPEFTAVVLAGGEGTRLAPLCPGQPKALIPVANKPMIFYPLSWLASGGYTNPIIIATRSVAQHVSQWLEKDGWGYGLQAIIHEVDDGTDTAEALRAALPKIKRDAMVVSCDTITDIPLAPVLDFHRTHLPAATVVFKHSIPEEKAKQAALQVEYVGLDATDPTKLELFASSSEADQGFELKKGFLFSRPNLVLTTTLMDSHIYILSRWALDVLAKRDNLISIKNSLLPVLSTQQHRRVKEDMTLGSLEVPVEAVKPIAVLPPPFPPILYPSDISAAWNSTLRSPTGLCSYIVGGKFVSDEAALKEAVKPRPGEFLFRINYINSLLEASKTLMKGMETGDGPYAKLLAQEHEANWTERNKKGEFPPKVFVSPPSLIGVDFRPQENVTIKSSTIGKDVSVGSGTRIRNSIIMDSVRIEEGCTITGCVVGGSSVIPAGTVMTDCIVGYGVDELKKGEYTDERL